MTPFVLLGMHCLLLYPSQSIDVALTARQLTSKDTYRMSYNYARTKSNKALLKGYTFAQNVKATHSGAIYLAGRRTVFYGVQDKRFALLSEIGLDLNRNKVFEKSEVGHFTGNITDRDSQLVYAFRNNPAPLVFLTARGTAEIQASPANLKHGVATFGDKKLSFTVGDSNYNGRFDKDDLVLWANHDVRTQSVSSLFVMPDGKYYTASLPSQSLLSFSLDKRPTGTVSIKNGLIESSDIRVLGNRFEPIIQNGSILLPEDDYFLNVLVYSTTGINGKPCRIGVWGRLKPYRIAGGQDLRLDPGPINRVGVQVRRSRKAFNLQLEAYTRSDYTVYALNFSHGNSLSRPPAPVVEIVDQAGAIVAKITLKYG